MCGDLADDILFELYETIVIVIYSSYLSQKSGNSYYRNMSDQTDDSNGLLSKEILKKNEIDLMNSSKELDSLSSSLDIDLSLEKIIKPKPVKKITQNLVECNDPKIRISNIWDSKLANTPTFKFQVYAQQYCPLGNLIIKEEALHKRSVHWVESIQTKCTPKNGRIIIEKKKKSKKI